jgi:predicted ribonuclease YlaK
VGVQAVQRELDMKKEEMHTQTGRLARQAGRDMDGFSKAKNRDKVPLLRIQRSWETNSQLPSAAESEMIWRKDEGWREAHTKTPLGRNDGSILLCSLFFVRCDHQVTLVSNDTNLRVWAGGYGVKAAAMKDLVKWLCRV